MAKKIKIRQNSSRRWLIAIIIVLIIFGLGFVLKPIISSWIVNAQNHFYQSGTNTYTFFNRIIFSGSILKQNELLKIANQELSTKLSYLENVQKENEELRKVLDLELQKEFKFIDAYVYAKDINTDSIYINKGEEDGVKEGFVIINPQKILIGKVIKIFSNHSLISLITAPSIKTNVEIGDSQIEAIARGKGNMEMIAENIPQDKAIKNGDVVITGNLQNDYPQGLPLGTVKYVKLTDLDPFQTAIISPYLDLNSLGLVLVIPDF
ncbi:MAG: rod shape-determining protein MreC [Candidatus Pacebacteria bacterium]|nr:rod shape-determining protein MreC [Candidatus Paceibacterota bacterium]